MSLPSSLPFSLINEADTAVTAVLVEEVNNAGVCTGPGPGTYQQQLEVHSRRHGTTHLPVQGFTRNESYRITFSFANGNRVQATHITTDIGGFTVSRPVLPTIGAGSERYVILNQSPDSMMPRPAFLPKEPALLFITNSSIVSRWMSELPNNRPLHALSIPGTHDTCALHGGPSVECQSTSLIDQLNAGIRFIDIRCRHIENVFTIHHGAYYQHLNFGAGVRDVCLHFLERHPNECIIMSVKHEYNEEKCTRSFEQTFNSYLEGNRSRWYLGDTVPTLGDVRGKIVLFRRFGASGTPLGIDASNWPDNASFETSDATKAHLNVQDEYVVPTIFNVPDKWAKVEEMLKRAAASTSNYWHINFTSGAQGAFPKSIAEGALGITGENDRLHTYLNDHPTGKTGTVVMDFPEYPDKLIKQIIDRN